MQLPNFPNFRWENKWYKETSKKPPGRKEWGETYECAPLEVWHTKRKRGVAFFSKRKSRVLFFVVTFFGGFLWQLTGLSLDASTLLLTLTVLLDWITAPAVTVSVVKTLGSILLDSCCPESAIFSTNARNLATRNALLPIDFKNLIKLNFDQVIYRRKNCSTSKSI